MMQLLQQERHLAHQMSLVEQAENARLAEEAQRGQAKSGTVYHRLMVQVGRGIVTFGERLQQSHPHNG